MSPGESFQLVPPDSAWPSAILFETPEQIYQRVYRMLRPRSPVPEVTFSFARFANANSFITFQDNCLNVRIADLLDEAPSSVHESLAFILLCKVFHKPIPRAHVHRYRLYLNRQDMRRRAEKTRQERGRKLLLPPQGRVYDLEEIFEDLNRRFFFGLMVRPILGWSLQASRTRLGHYDPSHKAILISRIFDDAAVLKLALEYVLFHEMLHLEFPVEHSGARCCVHTKRFKERERQFPGFEEAKRLIQKL